MKNTVHVLGFSGSLRKGSYNAALLAAAAELLPEGMTLETFDLSPIPLYNDDVRAAGYPDSVRAFRDRIATADGLLIVTPEYNLPSGGTITCPVHGSVFDLSGNRIAGPAPDGSRLTVIASKLEGDKIILTL